MRVFLCHGAPGCPTVETAGDKVHIGEDENVVRLAKLEWNTPVAKIKAGELREL